MIKNKENSPSNFITYNKSLEGYSDEKSVYGAQYITSKNLTPYYERTINEIIQVPWLAQKAEWTYMNRTKPLNDISDKKSFDLNFKLIAIPKENYEKYLETFDNTRTQNLFFKISFMLFVIMIIWCLSKHIT